MAVETENELWINMTCTSCPVEFAMTVYFFYRAAVGIGVGVDDPLDAGYMFRFDRRRMQSFSQSLSACR